MTSRGAHRSMRRGACAAAALSALWASAAHAQFPGDIPRPIGQQPVTNVGINVAQKLPFWNAGAARPFVAATFDAGVIYLRPTLAVGYGKPHWQWIGVEGYGSIASSGGSEYVGIRAALPFVELRGGVKYTFDVSQYFLVPRETYSRDQAEQALGPKERYLTYEVELSGSIPLPRSALFGGVTLGAVNQVPDFFPRGSTRPVQYYVFEDSVHAIIDPPAFVRGRFGYLVRFGFDENLKLGVASDLVYSPGRDAATFRVGPVFAVTLSHHLDASASFLLAAAGTDSLGLQSGDFTTIGLRYRWATGDRWPEFP
jgi:hypothetical protein